MIGNKKILIRKTARKCGLCAQVSKGLLLQSAYYENLPPFFLCDRCFRELKIRTEAVEAKEKTQEQTGGKKEKREDAGK